MNPDEKAKVILAAIIQAAGGSFFGKTRLYKAFYVAHLLHYTYKEGVLSDHPIVRMPKGPAVDNGDKLIQRLKGDGILATSTRPNGPYTEEVFKLSAQHRIEGLSDGEMDSIRQAVAWIGDKTAAELSEWTHEYSNTWNETPNGKVMNIYADLLTESEYGEMKRRQTEVGELVDAVFGE